MESRRVPSEPPTRQTDFVRIATCSTPTEAHVIRGVLESAGLSPVVADANLVQAHGLMTQAVGGVRVLVPPDQIETARQALADFNAGALSLEGEEVPVVSRSAPAAPLFSPDRAVLLGFFLTPAFAQAIQIANARTLRETSGSLSRWLWFCALASASAAGVVVMHAMSPGPLLIFRASFVLSFVTVVWYFIVGQAQSRAYLSAFGVGYARRSLMAPTLVTAGVLLLAGWVMSGLA